MVWESRLVIVAYEILEAKEAFAKIVADTTTDLSEYRIRDAQRLRSRVEVNLWVRTDFDPLPLWRRWEAQHRSQYPLPVGALAYVNVRENPIIPPRINFQDPNPRQEQHDD